MDLEIQIKGCKIFKGGRQGGAGKCRHCRGMGFWCRKVPGNCNMGAGKCRAAEAFLVQGSARGSIFSAGKCGGQTPLPQLFKIFIEMFG